MITFEDSADTTHTKAYLITAAETKNEVDSIQPDQVRLSITPPLVKNVANEANIILGNKRQGVTTLLVPKVKSQY